MRDGYERASTNRIAAAAGVSIGSLYQYFPGKEALVAAVVERHNRDLMAVIEGAMAEVADAPLEVGVRRLVAAALEAHAVDPELHRVLAEQTPRAGALADVELFHRRACDLFRAYLETKRDEIGVDAELAAFVGVTTVEALTHAAVIHRPEILAHNREALLEEASRLVIGYLRGPEAPTRRLRAAV